MAKDEIDVTANVRDAWLSGKPASATVPMKRERGRPPAPFKLTTPKDQLARPIAAAERPEFVTASAALGDLVPKKSLDARGLPSRGGVNPEQSSRTAPNATTAESTEAKGEGLARPVPTDGALSTVLAELDAIDELETLEVLVPASMEPEDVEIADFVAATLNLPLAEEPMPDPIVIKPRPLPGCTMTGCRLAGALLECRDGHVRCIAHAAALMLDGAAGGPLDADRELVQAWLDEGGIPAELPIAPSFTVTVALNRQQEALLENLVAVGLFGDSAEAAAHFLIAEGLARHFPRSHASLGFKP